jgi:CspA family cold shock protein
MDKQFLGPAMGTVKWFSYQKGYGFLLLDDGRECFLHISGLRDPEEKLQDGLAVTLRLYKGDRGLFARAVELVR